MITIDNFEKKLGEALLKKARPYAANGSVLYLDEEPENTWQAEVAGTETYSVEIKLDKRTVAGAFCDCPVDEQYCKQVAAVLLVLRQQLAKPKPKTAREPQKLTLDSLLAKATADELRAFILVQAAADTIFAGKLQLHFADKDERVDVGKQYGELLKKAIRANTDRGYVDYQGAKRLAKEVDKLLAMAVALAHKRNFRDAISAGQMLALGMMDVVKESDDSAGSIGGCVSEAIELLHDIARDPNVAPALRQSLYDWTAQHLLDKTFGNYGDYHYELLDLARDLALTLPDPLVFTALLDDLIKRYAGGYGNHAQDRFKTLKISILTALGKTDEVARLTEANLDVVAIRNQVLDAAIAAKDWKRAGELIAGGISVAQQAEHPGTVRHWEERMLAVARLTNDLTTIRLLTSRFAFDRHSPDLTYYRQWKQTYPAPEWPAVFARLEANIRAEEAARETPKITWHFDPALNLFQRLTPLFVEETQWDKLLALVLDYPKISLDDLAKVHPYLAPHYPADLLALYMPRLTAWGDRIDGRIEYQKLAGWLGRIKKDVAGSTPAIHALIDALKAKYPKRLALQEEMNTIKRQKA